MSTLRTVLWVVLGFSTVVQATPSGAILYATRGTVERYTPDGQHQTLMHCERLTRYRLLVPPYTEQKFQEPCSMSNLVTHAPTGRWAVSVSVLWMPNLTALDMRVDGRSVTLPTQPDGKHLEGNFIVWGDQSGTKGVSHGVASSWYSYGSKWDLQIPVGFSERGDALLISAPHPSESGGARRHVPEALRIDFETGRTTKVKLARGKTVESCVGAWTAAGLLEDRLGMCADTKGLQVAVPISDEEVVTYVEGRPQPVPSMPSELVCDPLVSSGSWRRRNLRTGRDSVILNDDMCQQRDPLPVRSLRSDAVFLRRLQRLENQKILYRYSPSTGAVRIVTAQLQSLLDVSADGEEFIGDVYGAGFGVFDARTGEKKWNAAIEYFDTMSSAGFVAY